MFDFEMIAGLAAGAFLASVVTASAAVTVGYATGVGSTPNPFQLAPTSLDPASGNPGAYTGDATGRLSAFNGIIAKPSAAYNAAE